jgi:nucleotide-binding universal stress UspA family protein
MSPVKRGGPSSGRVRPEKILIALDDSAGAWQAVEYVGFRFSRSAGVRITLLHILPDLPPEFWDIGHFLSRTEQQARQRVIDEWEKGQGKKWSALVKKARAQLVRSGISAAAVRRKFVPGVGDPATEIVTEARKGRFSTIVIGRGGERHGPSSPLGGNADRVVRLAWDLNVIVAGAAGPRP